MSKTFYCTQCQVRHNKSGAIGDLHERHAETEEQRVMRETNLCDTCTVTKDVCGGGTECFEGPTGNIYRCSEYEEEQGEPDPTKDPPTDDHADPMLIIKTDASGGPGRGVALLLVPGDSTREVARARLAEHVAKEVADQPIADGAPFLAIQIQPCGQEVVYATLEDVPLEDVPCPCGDPTHFMVMYQMPPDEPPADDKADPEPRELQPPRKLGCDACQDTGQVQVGTRLGSDGKDVPLFRLCNCGKETHDERIGLTPRRSHLSEPAPISEDDAAEADYRRSHGGTADEYLERAAGDAGSGSKKAAG